jgi:hypothetical protein
MRGDLKALVRHGIGLDEFNCSYNSNTCGNRNEVQLWIWKRVVMVLSEFGKHRSFSVIHVTARWPCFPIALPISSIARNLLMVT